MADPDFGKLTLMLAIIIWLFSHTQSILIP